MVPNELIPLLETQHLDTSQVSFFRLVDGRLRDTAARQPTGTRTYRDDLRGEPSTVAVPRSSRIRFIRRGQRLVGELCVQTALTDVHPDPSRLRRQLSIFTRQPNSSQFNCPTRLAAISRSAGIMGISGARSCRLN